MPQYYVNVRMICVLESIESSEVLLWNSEASTFYEGGHLVYRRSLDQ